MPQDVRSGAVHARRRRGGTSARGTGTGGPYEQVREVQRGAKGCKGVPRGANRCRERCREVLLEVRDGYIACEV